MFLPRLANIAKHAVPPLTVTSAARSLLALSLAVAGVSYISSISNAEEPSNPPAPSTPPATRPVNPGRQPGRLAEAAINNLFSSEDEHKDFDQFIHDRMPITADAIRDPRPFFAQGSNAALARFDRRRWLTQTALFQYRRYTKARKDYPDEEKQYALDVKNTDEMIGLLREFRAADAGKRDEIRDTLHEKMQALARSLLAERKRRIDKLRASLEKEEQALARDENRLEDGVDRRLDDLLSKVAPIGPPTNTPSATPGQGPTNAAPMPVPEPSTRPSK